MVNVMNINIIDTNFREFEVNEYTDKPKTNETCSENNLYENNLWSKYDCFDKVFMYLRPQVYFEIQDINYHNVNDNQGYIKQ